MRKRELKFIQANLQRSKLATVELLQAAQKENISIALVQEPYVGRTGVVKQCSGTQVIQCTLGRQKPVKAAVIVLGTELEVIHDPQLVTENVAAVLIKAGRLKLGIISIYLEGDQDINPYISRIKLVCDKLPTDNLVVAGDINAWSHWWGSNSEDHRGKDFNNFLSEMNLQILNTGATPTFETYRGDRLYTSIVDVTVCSLPLLGKISGWQVRRGLTTSDHNAITFGMRLETALESIRPVTTRIYNTRKAKWTDFNGSFRSGLSEKDITSTRIGNISNPEELEESLAIYVEIIHKACETAIPKVGINKGEPKPPWWSPSLEDLKREVLRKKRRIKNAAASRRLFVINEYTHAKEEYKTKAAEAATQSWKEFCETQDRESMWDGIYRVIRKTARKQEDLLLRDSAGLTLSPEQSAELLAQTFYPRDTVDSETEHQTLVRNLSENRKSTDIEDLSADDPPFTAAELETVLNRLNPKKAPGPDGLTADICTAAIRCDREVFLALANKCLALEHFPKQWKVAHVCIIRKPGKDDYTHPKSYRPIGLLSVLGKIVEKLTVTRLQWLFLPTLNNKQYGFTPQRSTEDALYDLLQHINTQVSYKKIVLMVSLDIEGAFDNAWWPALKKQLINKRCPKNLYGLITSYLCDRTVRVNYARAVFERGTNKGCIQGSIGGPTFWNLILDTLLQKLNSLGVYCQAFADDVVLIFSAPTVEKIQSTANTTLEAVQTWGKQNKLNFAAHKTNAMIITRKLKYDLPIINMSGIQLKLVKEIKLLGLIIDCKLTFNSHVAATCRKAADIYKQLACAAKVSWGLNKEIIRTIYVSVIEPIVLYAASAWYPAAEKLSIRDQLSSLQRGFAIKICKAYRTVSLTSALILSGLLPLDLRVQEAAAFFKIKKGYSEEHIPPGREVEQKVGYLHNPHPSTLIITEFERLENLDPNTLETYHVVGPQIFTDGSKIEGKVGAALTWWDKGKETRYSTFRLESHNTVFQSEMYALYRAVKMARSSKAKTVNIMSDSRSSLELLKNPCVTHQLALEIKKLIAETRAEDREVRLFWLRAHVGTPGNERADQLAKKAALTKKTAPDYSKVPLSYIKRKIREVTIQKWQQRYESSTTGSVTKAFLPTVSSARRVLKDTTLTPTLVQVLTGHGGFAAYLHRFNLIDSPSCVCDSSCHETIWHILFECPRFGGDRLSLEIQTQTQLSQESLPTIMETESLRKPFLAFAAKIARVAAINNGSTIASKDLPHQPQVPTPTTPANSRPLITTTAGLNNVITPAPTNSSEQLLECAKVGVPKLRVRSVALFMDNDNESFGISFCREITNNQLAISPGLAALRFGSTNKAVMKRSSYIALPLATFMGHSCRVVRLQNKAVVLLEWKVESPFTQACLILTSLAQSCQSAGAHLPRIISVDAMAIGYQKGEVVDRCGCVTASKHYEVIVYEDRGENLDYLKPHVRAASTAPYHLPTGVNHPPTISGSERLQQKIAAERLSALESSRSPKECPETRSRMKALSDFFKVVMGRPTEGNPSGRQTSAVERFLTPNKATERPTDRTKRTRADFGQINSPQYRTVAKPLHHIINAFLEFRAIIEATREVSLATCRNIMHAYQLNNLALLRVRLEEADAAIYNNATSKVIHGQMSGPYMAAFSASVGFVPIDENALKIKGTTTFKTPEGDPIVVTARCTKIMLDDRILDMAKTIAPGPDISAYGSDWVVPDIKWINGVPGCGKTTYLVKHFDETNDVIATTTVEAAKDLREKLAHRIKGEEKIRVRTIASILTNGFRGSFSCKRLTVDEALMNHFGSIIMAAKLSGAVEVVLVGDVNQLPFIDRDNLFHMRYCRPDSITMIHQNLLCTHRNPMDVAFALSEVYSGIYSSQPRVHSLIQKGYRDAVIPRSLENTLYLVHTQEEKSTLSNQGYGAGSGSRILTIHEAQGLTYETVFILKSNAKKLSLHDSVPHAVVAISRHTKTCVYFADDCGDAIGRLIGRAQRASTKNIMEYCLKMALKDRNGRVVEALTKSIK
ncbi:uncharacterized protein LOC123701072 [Colias croceus]|uniref:uncharacterized protein LOC123701072 n=1 Tax=Colias crocea TaxID=72248 RepID=UPI001E2815BF|nr:uncharacterized protein LOC123701072 [Colias croceus]